MMNSTLRSRFQMGRLFVLFIALAVMLSYPVMALAQEEESGSTSSSSSAPTIQSDKEDYRPGETVILTGSNWQPGETVNIWVNDDEGSSWSRNVDVTADENGGIRDEFTLPDWFVAVYYVTATGDSGTVVKTTFTDGNVGIRNASDTPSTLTASYKLEGFNSVDCSGTAVANRTKTFSITGPGLGSLNSGDAQVASGNSQSVKVSITEVDPTTQEFKQWNSFDGNTVSNGALYGTAKSFCFPTQASTNKTFVGLFQSANKAPVADSQTVTTNEDTSKLITLSATDADNNTLTYKVTSLPTKGKLYKGDSTASDNEITSANTTLSGSTVTYAPNKDYNGSDSFKFVANDGTVNSSEATVSLTVSAVNDAPSFTKGADQTVAEDAGAQSVTGWASAISPGPSDESSQSVSFVVSNDNNSLFSTQPATDSSGKLTYTPAASKNGSATVTVYAKDNGGTPNDPSDDASSASQTFTITVTAVNDAPVAAAQSVSTNEDTSKEVSLSATDVDGDSLTYSIVAEPTKGTLTRTANGTYTYTPNANYNGSDSFTFKASDGSLDSNTATVSITVTAVNDAPVATAQSVSTDEDVAKSVTLAGTDADGDSLTYSVVSGPSNGTLSGTAPNLTYTPSANYYGSDSFTFKVNDGTVDSSAATVSITVSAVNDAPVAADDSATTDEDTATTVDVLNNTAGKDTDVDGDALSIESVTPPTNGTATITTDGKVEYKPSADFNGSDSFTYTVSDGQGGTDTGTVSITVESVNDKPVASDEQAEETDEDKPLTADLDADDVDGDSLSYTVGTEPSKGSVTFNDEDGTFTYTPNANENGTDSFTYTVSDGNGGSDTGTVSITVNAVNDAPVAANDDDEETDEDALLRGSLSATDVDKDALSYSLVDDATNGSVSVGSDGSYTYTPDENFHGTDFFTFKASDGTTDSNVAPVSITVNPVNDAPVAADDDTASTPEDTPLNGNLSATDIDEDPLSYSKGSTDAQHGTVTVNADGTYAYTPDENFHGTDFFTFKANDGTTDSNEATVTIDVTPVNDAPVAADDSATTDEDTPLSESVSADDIDSSSLTYSLVAQAANGTVTVNADGSFTYTPNADYNGADSFTFKANDGELDSNTATVSITVNSVNDAPVPEDDSATTPEDTPVDILASELLNNDSEGPTDESNQILSIKEVSNFVHGTAVLSSDGSKVTFTPEANYYGAASFDYTVCDNGSPQKCSTQTATVNVTVSAVNDAPVADNDSYSVDEDGTLTEAAPGVLDGDTDVENSTLTATKVAGPSHGTLTLNSDGSFEYKPNANYHGSDSFTYTASDGELDSESATVSITVDPVNDAPTADAQSVSTDEDKATAITLSGSDIDGDSLTYKVASNPAHGQLSGTGANLTYTPDENYNGSDSFTFKANDGDLDSNTATVSITVNSVNDAPVAGDDNAGSTDEDAAKDNINVLGNDTDADSDILSVTSVTQGSSGSVTINSDSTLKYTPKANYHGPDSFTYTVSDGNNGTDTAKVSINVEPVNDAPTLSASNNGPVKEGSPVTITANANDADGDTLSYEFDCDNNGTYDKAPQSGSTYQCTFNDNGTSTVGVRATDGNGGEKTATTSVTIDNVAPTLGNLSLDGNTGTACATNNVKLAFSFDDPAKANDTYTGTIDWGDGSTTNFGSSFSVNESHDYKPGTYTIKVNVKDEDGGQAAEKQAQVSRQYQVTKLLDPVNANTDGKTPSVFKYGSTIPLKVKITDCNNNPVSGLAPKISIKQYNLATPSAGVNETILNTSTHSDYVMRDAGSGQYIYNLASKSLSDGDAQYTATVTDASFGSMQSQVWGLRTK